MTLSIDETLYSREAVMRASHWYTDRLYISLSKNKSGRLSVALKPREKGICVEALADEFQNSLLDAQLRVEIARETNEIRQLIVAKAFAEGNVLEDPPVGDWKDPVGISKGRS